MKKACDAYLQKKFMFLRSYHDYVGPEAFYSSFDDD